MSRRFARGSAIALSLWVTTACEDEGPYTPYGVASTATVAQPTSKPTEPAAADAGQFATQKAVLAPRNTSSWKLGGHTIEAPKDRVFERGLAADLDGDGTEDAIAWTVPAENAPPLSSRGELWYYPNGKDPRRTLPLAGFVPTAPGCKISTTLSQTGPKTVTVDVSSKCSSALLSGSPTRSLTVVAPAAAKPVVVGLRIADPPKGEQMTWSVESIDSDNDGLDDVRVGVELSADGAKAQAALLWFDRAAGASRDSSEPALSLAKRASVEKVRAKGKKSGKTVPARVAAVRRLYAALCDESRAARVTTEDGQGIRCGDLTKTVARLLSAEVQAALTLGNVREAFAALSRAGWYAQAVDDKTVEALEKKVLGAVKTRTVDEPRSPNATVPRRTRPRYSPLGFESSGDLLIVGRRGILSRSRAGGFETERLEADAGVRAWDLTANSPSGLRFSGVNYPCHRPGALLLVQKEGGGPESPIETSLLSPRPCPRRAPKTLPAVPLGWTDSGLSAIVGGSLVGPPAKLANRRRGTPFSPDGKFTISVTHQGLLITGESRAELWSGAGIGSAERLTDCVVSNGAKAAACVDGTRVLVFEPS